MNQPTTLTARRFYHAFYCWTLLTTSTPPPPQTSSHKLCWTLHASSRGIAIQNPPQTPPALVRRTASLTKDSKDPTQTKSPNDPRRFLLPREWLEEAVRTSTEQPFDTLHPWQEIVRDRSNAGILIQISVPAKALAGMEKRYGAGLVQMKERFGAKVEVGQNAWKDGMHVKSVLLSGTYEEVAAVGREVRRLGYGSGLVKGRGLRILRPSGGRDTSVASSAQHGEVKEREASSAPFWGEVKSYADRPTSRIGLWNFQLRHISRQRCRVQMIVSAQIWHDITNKSGTEGLKKKEDVSFEIGEVFVDSLGRSLRSLFMMGETQSLRRVRDRILSARSNLSKKAAREDEVDAKEAASTVTPPAESSSSSSTNDSRSADMGFPSKDGELLYDTRLAMPPPLLQKMDDMLPLLKRLANSKQPSPERSPSTKQPPRCLVSARKAGIYIRGTKEEVETARERVEILLRTACEEEGIPTTNIFPLQHLSPLTSLADRHQHRLDLLHTHIKNVLRSLTHPVVVVTATATARTKGTQTEEKTRRRIDNPLDSARGVTISSFNTVTITPVPIISFNLKLPSRTWDAISSSGGRLVLHTLSASPHGAAIAHAFTQPSSHPAEPFCRLRKRGAFVFVETKTSGGRPPWLGWTAAAAAADSTTRRGIPGVTARIEAKVLRGKCVWVGDHVVVVAEVGKVVFPGEEGKEVEGLAYARRGYRGVGRDVEPLEVDDVGEEVVEDEGARGVIEDEGVAVDRLVEGVDEEDSREIDERYFQATEEAVDNVDDLVNEDGSIVNQEHEEGLDADSEQILEDTGRLESSPPKQTDLEQSKTLGQYFEQHDAQSNSEANSSTRTEEGQSSELPQPGHVSSGSLPTSDATMSPKNSESHREPKHGSAHAWGIERPLKSSYSTLTPNRHTRRDYCTSPLHPSNQPQPTQENHPPTTAPSTSYVSSPSLLPTTIADFLDHPEPHTPPPRHRTLIRMQKAADRASDRLERALADGTLTPFQSSHLEHIIARNDRRIAKAIALRSAAHLRRMLDTGKVDVRRWRWLEGSIEKGQAVLLEEARGLARMLEEGRIGGEEFGVVRGEMERDMGVLRAEVGRLRDVVDEDMEVWEGGRGKG